MTFAVGDRMRAKVTVVEPACGGRPAMVLAKPGELLFIRKLHAPGAAFPYSVSHQGVHDSSFQVAEDEIEAIGTES